MYVLHNTLESTAFESKLATITSLLTDISFCRQKHLANIGTKTNPTRRPPGKRLRSLYRFRHPSHFLARMYTLSLETHASSHPSIDLAETFPLLRRTCFIIRVLLWFVDKSPSTSLRTCSILSAAGKMSSRNRAKIEPFAPAFPSGM